MQSLLKTNPSRQFANNCSTPAEVANAEVCSSLISRISVLADPAMDARGHTAVDLDVTTRSGQIYKRALDIAPGLPRRRPD